MFTPILQGREEAVSEAIESLPLGAESPLARLEQLHFSRLQIFDRLVYQGPPQKPDRLKSSYLVFTATFDGDLDPFLDAICERLPTEADSWWSHCVAYPGTGDPSAFRRYLKHNQIRTTLFASAHPNARVDDVLESLDLRERLMDFAVAAQIEPAELQQRFRETFGSAA
jgi:hypothetical protein